MSCKLIARNGKPSILGDTLKVVFGNELGAAIYNQTRSFAFNAKMSGSKFKDKNGEAIPMFYGDKYNVDNKKVKDIFKLEDDVTFLTTEYGTILRGKQAPHVVFVNSPSTTDISASVIPNVNYLKDNSKGAFGMQNTININSGKEVIVFDNSHIITEDDITKSIPEHEKKRGLYSIITNENAKTSSKNKGNIVNNRLVKNKVKNVAIEVDEDQLNSTEVIAKQPNVTVSLNFNKFKSNIFTDEYNILASMLYNIDSEGYNALYEMLDEYKENGFIKDIYHSYEGLSRDALTDELISSILAAKAYIKNNQQVAVAQDTIDSLNEVLDKLNISPAIEFNFNRIVDELTKLTNDNAHYKITEPKDAQTNTLNLILGLSSYKNILNLSDRQNEQTAKLKTAERINFKSNLFGTLHTQLRKNQSLYTKYRNSTLFNTIAPDDTEARKKAFNDLKDKMNTLEFGNNRLKVLAALVSNHMIDSHNLELVKEFLSDLERTPIGDLTRLEQLKFGYKANAVREILASITDVKNVNKLKNSLLSVEAGELSKEEAILINKEIEDMQELEVIAESYRKRYAVQEDKVNQYIVATLPEREARIALSSLVDGIKDINMIQYNFDSLMDVDNALAASYKKRRTDLLFEKDKEVRTTKYRVFNKLKAKMGSAWDTKEGREAFMKDLVDGNGKLHQLYSNEVYTINEEKLGELINIKNTGSSTEYRNAKENYNRWYAENFNTQYTQDYYDIINKLPLDIKTKLNEYAVARQDVIDEVKREHNQEYRVQYLTADQRSRLDSIYRDKKEYVKSLDKEMLKEYYEGLNDIFINSPSNEYYYEYEDTVRLDGIEEASAWYMRNGTTSDKFNAERQEQYEVLKKNKGDNGYLDTAVRTLLDDMLLKYTDSDGVVDMSKVSSEELDLVKYASIFLSLDKGTVLKGLNADELALTNIRSITKKQMSAFKKRVPVTQALIDSAKTKESLIAVKWLQDNLQDSKTDYYFAEADKARAEDRYDEWFEANHIPGTETPFQGWTKSIPSDMSRESGNVIGKGHFSSTSEINSKYIDETVELDSEGRGNPVDKWFSKKYASLSDVQKDVIGILNDELGSLTDHLRDSIIRQGYLPGIEDVDSISEQEKEETQKSVMMDTAGEKVFNIPFYGISLINQNKKVIIRPKAPGELTPDYIDYQNVTLANEYGIAIPTSEDELSQFIEDNNLDVVEKEIRNLYDKYATKVANANPNNLSELDIYQAYAANVINSVNKAIAASNKESHTNAVSLDIKLSLEEFIPNALSHKYKLLMEGEARLGMSVFREANYLETDSAFNKVHDAYNNVFKKNKAKDGEAIAENKESLLYKRYAMDMEMIFYERFMERQPYNKALLAIKEYVALAGIGFNLMSAIKNVGYGGLMMDNEANTGINFNRQDLAAGTADFMRTVPKMGAMISRDETDEITDPVMAMLIHYNVVDSHTESDYIEQRNRSGKSKARKAFGKTYGIVSFVGFYMQEKGESFMQNSVLLAMLRSHRVIDGKILSFDEFAAHKLGSYTTKDVHEARRNNDYTKIDNIIAQNKVDTKTLKEEFEKYDTVYNSGEIIENEWTVTNVDEGEDASFRTKVQGINQKAHGIYNKSDKGPIEHKALGQLLMQYRHWLRPGWVKRFGSRGLLKSNRFYNVRRKEYDEGSWKVLKRFLNSPFEENGLDYFKDEGDENMLGWVKAAYRGQKDLIVNAKRYWNVMSEREKQEVIRASHELAVSIALASLLLAMRGLKDDDDEPNWFYSTAVYLTEAILSESVSFLPVYGWFGQFKQMLTNPVAAFSQTEKLLTLAGSVMMYPMRSPEERIYRGGKYYGHDKVAVQFGQVLPIWNQVQRLFYMNENDKYYKSQFFGSN